MRIIVADRNGLVASVVRRGFPSNAIYKAAIVVAHDAKELVSGMVHDDRRILVLSAQLIPGFTSVNDLAKFVKEKRTDALFYVFSGSQEEQGLHIDHWVPCSSMQDFGKTLIPALQAAVRDEATGQLRLL